MLYLLTGDEWLRDCVVLHARATADHLRADLDDNMVLGRGAAWPLKNICAAYEITNDPQLLEAAAIGMPHPVMGQVVKAVVVLKPGRSLTEAEVKRQCADRLASFKVPQRVEFVDQLPRNPSGKVVKRLVRICT